MAQQIVEEEEIKASAAYIKAKTNMISAATVAVGDLVIDELIESCILKSAQDIINEKVKRQRAAHSEAIDKMALAATAALGESLIDKSILSCIYSIAGEIVNEEEANHRAAHIKATEDIISAAIASTEENIMKEVVSSCVSNLAREMNELISSCILAVAHDICAEEESRALRSKSIADMAATTAGYVEEKILDELLSLCVATFSQDIADDVEANRLVTDARFIHNIALTRAARKTKNMEEKSISLREPKLDQNDMKEQDIGIIDRCRLFSSLRSWQQFWKANGRFAKQDNSSSIANSAREIHMTGNHPNSIASLEKLHSQREASDKHQTIKAFIRQHWLIIALFILELVFVTKTMSRIMYKNEGTTDSPLPTCFLNKIWPRKRHEEQCADVPTGSDHWTNERKEVVTHCGDADGSNVDGCRRQSNRSHWFLRVLKAAWSSLRGASDG